MTKTTDEGEPINVFVKTPMVRINGDIRDAATKREYPFQKLADGQSNLFVIEVWHFNCRTHIGAVNRNRKSTAGWNLDSDDRASR